MHPPLEVHQHPACKDVILALKSCHKDNPFAKYWGVCNDKAKELNVCFRAEKVVKRAENKEKIQKEQERLRARIDSRRRDEAEKRGEAAPEASVGSAQLPGYSFPEVRGIPGAQQAAAAQ